MSITARDIMQSDIETVSIDMPLAELDREFLNKGIGAFPVERDHEVVGIVSRSDVVRQLSLEQSNAEVLAEGYGESPVAVDASQAQAGIRRQVGERIGRLTVESLMIVNPVSVEASASIKEVAETMVSKHVHRLLVTDGGKIVGIVSALDLAAAIADGRSS